MRDSRAVADADLLWGTCCDLLRDQVTDGVWKSTFQGIHPVAVDHHRLVLAVPSGVVADRIHGTYRSLVADAVVEAHGEPLDLVVEVHAGTGVDVDLTGADPRDAPRPAPEALDPLAAPPEPSGDRVPGPAPAGTTSTLAGVDALYTFEDFVIGQSNRFSYAAAMAVAETPGRAYNPLFIYGDAGLGKTHLLQSIRAYMAENYPGKVVRYVSTESFLNDFIESIRLKTMADFKRRYRDLDVLLVDDIQFIEGAERFQEEFFHTFNELHARRSQIVLTSDRSPDASPPWSTASAAGSRWG